MRTIGRKRAFAMGVALLILVGAGWLDPDGACLSRSEARTLSGGCPEQPGCCEYYYDWWGNSCNDSPECFGTYTSEASCTSAKHSDNEDNLEEALCSTWPNPPCGSKRCVKSGFRKCAKHYECYWNVDRCEQKAREDAYERFTHCVDEG